VNTPVLDLLDSQLPLPQQLERWLVGPQLREVVAELQAAHGPGSAKPSLSAHPGLSANPSLEDVLGPDEPALLERGLAALPAPALQQLLKHPQRLLLLQEKVLVLGSAYWQRRLNEEPAWEAPLAAGERKLLSALRGTSEPSRSKTPAARPLPELALAPQPRIAERTSRRALAALIVGAILGTAATVAIMLQMPASSAGLAQASWGWQRPDAFPKTGSAADYFQSLANSAEEYFRLEPPDAAALAQRVGEFRQGCSRLILTAHPLLLPADQTELKNRCQKWAARLDAHLVALESGADVFVVRDETAATVRTLINFLRKRSEELRASA